jgi:hypothetical protein
MRTVLTFLLSFTLPLAAQDMQSCPMRAQHMKASSEHQSDVEQHGDQAMGFSHDTTTHHFRIYPDGGAIEVTADNSSDSGSIEAIRAHLTHIAAAFSEGNFSIPMFVHSQVPPGVPTMQKDRARISYTFETLPAGGRVRITSTDADAVKAIHDFLRFQIEDHNTGDPTGINSLPAER